MQYSRIYLLQKKFSYLTVIIDCCNVNGCKTVIFGNIQDVSGLC